MLLWEASQTSASSLGCLTTLNRHFYDIFKEHEHELFFVVALEEMGWFYNIAILHGNKPGLSQYQDYSYKDNSWYLWRLLRDGLTAHDDFDSMIQRLLSDIWEYTLRFDMDPDANDIYQAGKRKMKNALKSHRQICALAKLLAKRPLRVSKKSNDKKEELVSVSIVYMERRLIYEVYRETKRFNVYWRAYRYFRHRPDEEKIYDFIFRYDITPRLKSYGYDESKEHRNGTGFTSLKKLFGKKVNRILNALTKSGYLSFKFAKLNLQRNAWEEPFRLVDCQCTWEEFKLFVRRHDIDLGLKLGRTDLGFVHKLLTSGMRRGRVRDFAKEWALNHLSEFLKVYNSKEEWEDEFTEGMLPHATRPDRFNFCRVCKSHEKKEWTLYRKSGTELALREQMKKRRTGNKDFMVSRNINLSHWERFVAFPIRLTYAEVLRSAPITRK